MSTRRRNHLPSFAESQFEVILRRQLLRPRLGGGSKAPPFTNASEPWKFSGWGTTRYLELTNDDLNQAEDRMKEDEKKRTLGAWTASAVASNAVTGSIFYAFPPLTAAIGVYSPISLTIATLLLFLYRPIMSRLATAFPHAGSNYLYLLNTTSKSFAVLAAALTLLDYLLTALTTSSTAAVYIASSTSLPFPTFVLPILIILFFSVGTLAGVRDGYRTALFVSSLHALSVGVLAVAGVVTWAKNGGDILKSNWEDRKVRSASGIAKTIFDGICIAFLGLTGFECAPECITSVQPKDYSRVLRNLHIPAMLFNGPLLLITYAVLTDVDLQESGNILATLGSRAGGRWLEIWIVTDAAVVLSFGVLTGILSTISLIQRLSVDRVIPSFFTQEVTWAKTPPWSILAFVFLSGVLYATTAADIVIISQIFTVVWLTVMFLFPVAYIFLVLKRPSIIPSGENYIWLALFTVILIVVVTVNNLVLNIKTLLFFSAYSAVVWGFLEASRRKAGLLKILHYVASNGRWIRTRRSNWSTRLGTMIVAQRKEPVCILIKTDNIHTLLSCLLYVSRNEDTSLVWLIHCYDKIESVPSELEANHKILDEAFPDITVDLVFVQAQFSPQTVNAISAKLEVPMGNMFMNASKVKAAGTVAFDKVRIIGP
ncbi:hypothetical protein BT69DRAFT_1220705 [Atractiella rhizophila]|nr:hypothetical protein BT69DRAFT_1220705 [Atractiella rhizophila]